MLKSNHVFEFLLAALMVVSLVAGLPVVNAQPKKATWAFINATPNPVGVNQEVLIHYGITDALARADLGWTGLKVIIERPDGVVEKFENLRTDSTGGSAFVYVPRVAGTYYLQTIFPEQLNPETTLNVPKGTVMLPSVSEKLALVVKEEPIPAHPGFKLPREYWTRPIDAQFREWTYIAGNWLQFVPNKFAPYNEGPETPHILWAKPLVKGVAGLGGGLAGGFIPQTSGIDEHGFECGDAYEGLFGTPVIIAGVLYFNRYKADGGTRVDQEVVAVDLRTGEEIWCKPLRDPDGVSRRLAFGQLFYWTSYNYHAVFAYLWTTATVAGVTYWHAHDASTGRWVYSMSNIPPAPAMTPPVHQWGPKGEIIRYSIDFDRGWMAKWNSTKVVTSLPTFVAPRAGSWIRGDMGTTLDARLGIEWNTTIPKGLRTRKIDAFLPDRILLSSTEWMRITPYPIVMCAISTAPGREGTVLFNTTWVPPQANLTITIAAVSHEDDVFVMVAKETRQFFGFSLSSGKLLWGPSEPKPVLDFFDITAGSFDLFVHGQAVIAYGKLFSGGSSGVIAAYDVKTGRLLWTYEAYDPYNEILWGVNWPLRIAFVTDGKIYVSHQEHSPIDPKPRGAPFICLDVETGEVVWRVDGLFRGTWWGGPPIIGDSIIATMCTYDQRIYAIGRGPTQTTVSAPDVGVCVGSTIVIRGTVMDISPGTRDYRIALRFPNGVPAVADECMGDWMLYVYKQFPRPAENMKGVWVKLDAVNCYTGEYIEIGGTHTDPYSGMFTVSWQPPKEGLWWIIASFPGSKSYWPSCARTSIAVAPAPTPPPTPEIPTPPDYTPMFTGVFIALAIAIILGIANLYMYAKKK